MLKRVIFAILIFYMILTALVAFFQEQLIFLPTKLPQEYTYTFDTPFEELFFETKDGANLNALHFKSEHPKGIILYFHGNAGDLSRWGEITSGFTQYNYDLLVMDYRTYGKSTGKLSEENLFNDAQLFYDFVKDRFPEDEIILYGRSLGSAFATRLAAENNPKMLILESPFYSLKSVAKSRFPILPVGLLIRYHFDNNKYIKNVNSRTVIFHGTSDNVVPFKSGKKLYEAASPKNGKHFVEITGGGHNDLSRYETYQMAIENILK
jgi:alpha-beta hydrolase superfamily lysophospholipase